jgi:AAA15 family ATPase/GTPase
MRIKSFSYSSDDWVLQKIDLQEVNLLVGKNGTGKSNTLFYINHFVNFILNESEDAATSEISNWKIILQIDPLNFYKYSIDSNLIEDIESFDFNIKIQNEILLKNENLLINRNTSECEIYSNVTNSFEVVNPPKETLVIHSRRDTKSYPFIEDILNWSKRIFLLNFTKMDEDLDLSYRINIPTIFNNLKTEQKSNVLYNFNHIGFSILKIEYTKNMLQEPILLIHDEGFDKPINYISLSQGMQRSLGLLIFIEYLINKTNTATLLIDDLGEGLDYIRATELGKLIFKVCEENNIQLIATTNDSFLMDVIDIDYWNVLKREGKVVSSINIVNNPKLFEDFRYTGLSRFDFFSSDYIDSHL